MPPMKLRALLLMLAVAGNARAADCPDGMAAVLVAEDTVCVDRWEASRADATATTVGAAKEQPPVSRPAVLPWTQVTRPEAAVACASAGKRLCTFAELGVACAGPDDLRWPWGGTYDGAACNGYASGLDKVVPTGSLATCVSPLGVYDLSGNVQEWTDSSSPAGNACVFGGDYYEGDLSAEQNKDSESCAPSSFACIAFEDPSVASYTNLGFRCCAAPGTVVIGPDAGGVDAGIADAGGSGGGAIDAAGDDGDGGDVGDGGGGGGADAGGGGVPDVGGPAPDSGAVDTSPGGGVGPLPDLVIGGPSADAGGQVGGGIPSGTTSPPVDDGGCGVAPGAASGLLAGWPLLLLALALQNRRTGPLRG